MTRQIEELDFDEAASKAAFHVQRSAEELQSEAESVMMEEGRPSSLMEMAEQTPMRYLDNRFFGRPKTKSSKEK